MAKKADYTIADIVAALRANGREANEGWQQRGGFHGPQGKAKTRADRRRKDWLREGG